MQKIKNSFRQDYILKIINGINIKELEKKIQEGIVLAYQKLVEEKKREGGELVFSQNRKINIVKARDL